MNCRIKCVAVLIAVGVGMCATPAQAVQNCDGRVQRAAFAALVDNGATCWSFINRFGPKAMRSEACQDMDAAMDRAEEESVRLRGCKYVPYGATLTQLEYVNWLADELRRFRMMRWDDRKGWVEQ